MVYLFPLQSLGDESTGKSFRVKKKLELEIGNIPGQFVLQSDEHSLSLLLAISNWGEKKEEEEKRKKKNPNMVRVTSVNAASCVLACKLKELF